VAAQELNISSASKPHFGVGGAWQPCASVAWPVFLAQGNATNFQRLSNKGEVADLRHLVKKPVVGMLS